MNIEELKRWYLELEKSGSQPNREKILSDHPEFADQLQQFFELQDKSTKEVNTVADNLHPTLEIDTGSVDPSVVPDLQTITFDSKASDDRNQSRVIGNYKLLQRIGSGGMGEVWMADQERPVRRRVAVELIKVGMDTKEVVARFEAERQALAMMDHQNIAKILDGGTTNEGLPYFVMELVQGVPFNQYCDKHKLGINERLNLFIPVCHAIQHAHQKGIIHRDLKPSNILVTIIDGKATPKVIDFGLAKALQHQAKLTDKTLYTEFGRVVGTLQYMSPEQAEMNALDVDTRTDIYSLGVVLYELLTGSTPIESETLKHHTVLKVLEAIRELDPPRPSLRLSSIGNKATKVGLQRQIDQRKLSTMLKGDLDWIVMKALEKDRSRRYTSAAALVDDIGRFLSGDAIEARPPSTSYKLRKIASKHKGLVASLAAVMIILCIGIAGTTYGLWRAEISRQAEKTQRVLAEQRTQEVIEARQKAEQEWNRAQQAEKAAEEKFFATSLEIAAQNPTEGQFYTFTNFFAERQQHEKALQLFDRFIENTDPKTDAFTSARWNKCIYLAEMGRFDEAFEQSRPGDNLSEDWQARVHMDHGVCGFFSEDRKVYPEALDSFVKSGSLLHHAYWEIAVRPVLLMLDTNQAETLLPTIETWCKTHHDADDMHWIQACGLAAAGHSEQALDLFNRGIKQNGSLVADNTMYNLRLDAWNYYFYAKALKDTGELEKSRDAIQNCLTALDSFHPEDGKESLRVHWIPRNSIAYLRQSVASLATSMDPGLEAADTTLEKR